MLNRQPRSISCYLFNYLIPPLFIPFTLCHWFRILKCSIFFSLSYFLLVLYLFDSELNCLELKLLLFLPSDHSCQFLFGIYEKWLSHNILHFILYRISQSTQLHLTYISRLTVRLSRRLTSQNRRFQVQILFSYSSLIMLFSEFSYILYNIATLIRTYSLIQLFLRIVKASICINILCSAKSCSKRTNIRQHAMISQIFDLLFLSFLGRCFILSVGQKDKRISHEMNKKYNKFNRTIYKYLCVQTYYYNNIILHPHRTYSSQSLIYQWVGLVYLFIVNDNNKRLDKYKQQIRQCMSLDKIRSAKNITYSDRYSKNPILNTLIKNKLETEMVGIKESFANIMKKQSDPDQHKNTRVIIKRNKSYTINPKSINQAIQYNPIERLNRYTEQFVAKRQQDSFLVPVEQIRQINNARQQHSGLTTKFSKADVIYYDDQIDLKELSNKVERQTVQQYDQEVWLPKKPEVLYLIQNKREQIQEEVFKELRKTNKEETIRKEVQKFSNKITGQTMSGSLNSKTFLDFPIQSFKSNDRNLQPTHYVHQKYHKNDYKLIENWLEGTIQAISKQQHSPEDKLNLLYTSYICVWKELIRLTYIEAQEKGLIIQKMFYSMLKLFWGLISEQQSLSRLYQRQSETLNDEVKKMMQRRMDQLNRRYEQKVKQNQKLEIINHRLSKVFISFEKVNHELVDQLEKMTKEKKSIQREFYNIGNSYFKALELLYDQRLIQMDFIKQESDLKSSKKGGPEYKTYFLFDKNSKPLVLGRFKSEDSISNSTPRFTNQAPTETVSEELKKYNERYGHNLKQIENELTRYWQKKQNDLEMKGIIDSLIMEVKIKDACCGTIKFETQQFSCQFPQNHENYVEKLLNQLRTQLNSKFQIERAQYQVQIQQKQTVFQRWKLSAEQLMQKNKILHENNLKLNETLKKTKEGSSQLIKQIQQLGKTIQKLKLQIQQLTKNLQISKMSEVQAKLNEANADKQRAAMKGQLDRQKQNNRMLVRGNLEAKQKAQKSQIKYNTILKSVKSVAPWLQKFMQQADKPLQQIQLNILRTVSNKIEQYLADYVTKDSGLFMTRLQ